jgi:hypothetical protein
MTYCPDCNAEVVHQKIPEDCSHCPCNFRAKLSRDAMIVGGLRPVVCDCECHQTVDQAEAERRTVREG